MPWLAAIKTFLGGVGGRVTLIAGCIVVFYFWAYSSGRSDCVARNARKAAQEAAAWAEKVQASSDAAYAKGLSAAKSEGKDRKSVEQITRDAGMEAGAGDTCVSSDLVDKLRALGGQ